MLSLVSVKANVHWAQQSLPALESEVSFYCNNRVDEIGREVPKSAYGVALPQNRPSDIPMNWSVLAGDICYNLRSSLDHLVWQLVMDNSETPAR